jgi:hypothetical protein
MFVLCGRSVIEWHEMFTEGLKLKEQKLEVIFVLTAVMILKVIFIMNLYRQKIING